MDESVHNVDQRNQSCDDSYAANKTTRTSCYDATTMPTILEISQADEIDSLLWDSIRYLWASGVGRWPSRTLISLHNWFPEWCELILRYTVEWNCLVVNDARIAQRCMGLRLINTQFRNVDKALTARLMSGRQASWPPTLRLTNFQRFMVCFERVILPYLKSKLLKIDNAVSTNVFLARCLIIIKKLYPLLKRFKLVADIILKLAYFSGRTRSTTLIELIFRIGYVRPMLPIKKDTAIHYNIDPKSRKVSLNTGSLSEKLKTGLLSHIANLFEADNIWALTIFALRFYQWYNTENIISKINTKVNSVDKNLKRPSVSAAILNNSGNCPICQNSIINPCVLETGYVACYSCTMKYLQNNGGRCPVTDKKLLGCIYDPISKKWDVQNAMRRLVL